MLNSSVNRYDYHGLRYIAMIDILGFSKLARNIDACAVSAIVNEVIELSKKYLASTNRTIGEIHFSDTILLWSPIVNKEDGDWGAFSHLCFAVTELIYRSLMKNIPLRAGIGFGDTYINQEKNIYVGEAIVDAYETEAAQQWIGGAIHPTVPTYICTSIKDYNVPVKRNAKICPNIALNWPDCPSSPSEYVYLKQIIDKLDCNSVSNDISIKNINTIKFATSIFQSVRLRRITENGHSDCFSPFGRFYEKKGGSA